MAKLNSLTAFLNPFRKRKPAKQGQTDDALFSRVRVQLTLWYGAVLALALVLLGVGLYIGVANSLYSPVQSDLENTAHFAAQFWQQQGLANCPLNNANRPKGGFNSPPGGDNGPDGPRRNVLIYTACYDTSGTLLAGSDSVTNNTSVLPTSFIDSNLAKTLLNSNDTSKVDVVDGGTQIGPIYRYALGVTLPTGQKVVLQLGRSVADSQSALDSLRNMLILLGVFTLVVATIGGFFLAQRALRPTRQAFARQQTFIADASHELRTPLTILKADAEVLLRSRERFDSDDAELLEDIVVEADRLTGLATNLLELARLDANQLYIEQEVFDLADVTGEVVHRLKNLADTKEISLHLESSDKVLILADSQLFEQVVLILLDNAVKYTPKGGSVTASVGVLNDQPFLRVKDTGIGISPEHLPNLGKRFYRVDKARARETGGSGLGLSLAFSIVKAHAGNLVLTSQVNEGTTATLTLPPFRLIHLTGEPGEPIQTTIS
jgi:signal transduction histidine kinase